MTERTLDQLLIREKHLEYVQDLLNNEITKLRKELQEAKTKLSLYEKKAERDRLWYEAYRNQKLVDFYRDRWDDWVSGIY